MSRDTEWTEADIAKLTRLWNAGETTSRIAAQMRRTRDSIIGKAHRLKLATRRSPIIRFGEPEAQRTPSSAPAAKHQPPVANVAEAVLADPLPAEARGPTKACCWPIGELRSPGFRICDAPYRGAGSYCPSHAAAAYVRPVKWQRDAVRVPADRYRL